MEIYQVQFALSKRFEGYIRIRVELIPDNRIGHISGLHELQKKIKEKVEEIGFSFDKDSKMNLEIRDHDSIIVRGDDIDKSTYNRKIWIRETYHSKLSEKELRDIFAKNNIRITEE